MIFNFDNERPIYLQLIEQIRFAIISGELAPGEKLPSVRDLASQARANPNTVQKALAELEEIGLVFTERTNGKYVTGNRRLIMKYRTELAAEKTNDYFRSMKKLGFEKNDIINHFIKKGIKHGKK